MEEHKLGEVEWERSEIIQVRLLEFEWREGEEGGGFTLSELDIMVRGWAPSSSKDSLQKK